jgi:putative ABC transport system permease protein
VMDRGLYIRKFNDDTINTIAVFLKPGVDPALARRVMEQRLGEKFRVFVMMNASIKTEVMRIFDQTFLITYALLAVSLIVAVLGIVNTLSALILERKREIALLRVVGMSARQISTMVVLESLVIGAASSLIGLVSGYVLSYILIFVVNKQSFGWTIEFDPPMLLVFTSLFLTFMATVVAGLIPSRLANRFAMSSELKAT